MLRTVRLLLLLPLAVALVVLAIANRQVVTVSLDPFSSSQALSFSAPLFWILFTTLATGIVIGGVSAWASQARWRRRARDSEREVKRLKNEHDNTPEGKDAQSLTALAAATTREAA